MTRLNATARATLREAGISQAAWARAHYSPDGTWSGDQCGCPDANRCANGFHHFGTDDCGCLPVLIEQYRQWLAGDDRWSFDREAPEFIKARAAGGGSHAVTEPPEPSPADREAFAAILRDYAGKVVAVKDAEVIASSEDVGALLLALRENGLRADSVFRVPDLDREQEGPTS